jgi:plastocyanin
MKRVTISAFFLLAAPLMAGDIHGTVAAKGVNDSANAVVYVAEIAGKTFAPPAEHAKMDQRNLAFAPKVLTVLKGTTVDFHNSDAVLHNVFSPDACSDHMDLGTWAQGQVKSFTFNKPCFAVVLCKVHAEMEGFVAVVPTPYHAVTAADGSYVIKDVPDGTYTVKVWHPKLKSSLKTVAVKGPTVADFAIAR